MLSTFCTTMGLVGWLTMLTLWAGLILLTVWGVTRLFPNRLDRSNRFDAPASPSEDDTPVGSGPR